MFTLHKCANIFASLVIAALITLAVAGAAPPAAALNAQSVTWYVTPTGNDANTCKTPAAPCRVIQTAIRRAAANDTVKVAAGAYLNTGLDQLAGFNRSIKLSGGWNTAFTAQNGWAVVDYPNATAISIQQSAIVSITRFRLKNLILYNSGRLTLNNVAISKRAGIPEEGINSTGPLTLNDTTISYNTPGITATGPLTINRSTITHNGEFGVHSSGGVTIDHSTISYNIGPGLWHGGEAIVRDSTINYNTYHAASNRGGGIRSLGSLTVQNSTIAYNSTSTSSPNNASAIDSYGPLTIQDSIISHNTSNSMSGSGAAIWSRDVTIIERSTLEYNSPAAVASESGSLTISSSTLSNNVGQAVGAHAVTLSNSTISGTTGRGSTSAVDGAAIYADISMNMNNTTITNNWVGVGFYGAVAGTFANNIVAGNSKDGGLTYTDCVGTFSSSGGYNLIGSGSTCTFTATTGDQVGTAAAPINPKLGPLANHGGPTLTHALVPGSPALNAGNPSAEPGSGGNACLATDQRGIARPALAAGVCDIGAYEHFTTGVLSIQRLDKETTSAGSVRFSVLFNDTVTGVEPADFAVTTADSIAGTSVLGVTGTDNRYVVTAATGSGVGSLRLDVTDDDGIVSAYTGEPLGGTGTGNGNFSAGETYTISYPVVLSVNRVSAEFTSAPTVAFTVTFSDAVNGVNAIAPFRDFRVTSSGITGAAVIAVTGSGMTYRVTVNRGTGSGTLQLDVVDDGTVVDPSSSRPLGGPGPGNGDFTAGQAYQIAPMPQTPALTHWDVTPTYKWSKVAGVTQYRYQLLKESTVLYTHVVPATICGASTCSATPAQQIATGNYSWGVQAYSAGAWRAYSPYKPFTLKAAKAGYWDNPNGWISFYVSPNRAMIRNFTYYVSVCNKNWVIVHPGLVPIQPETGKFAFTGQQNGNGVFTGATLNPVNASGRAGFTKYFLSGCGLISGSLSWSTYWINGSQPSAANALEQSVVVLRVPDAPFQLFIPEPVTPYP